MTRRIIRGLFLDDVRAGESLIWAMAMVSGKFEGRLRYAGEDGEYEKDKLGRLGL